MKFKVGDKVKHIYDNAIYTIVYIDENASYFPYLIEPEVGKGRVRASSDDFLELVETPPKYKIGDILIIRPILSRHTEVTVNALKDCRIAIVKKVEKSKTTNVYKTVIQNGYDVCGYFTEAEIAGLATETDVFDLIEDCVANLALKDLYRQRLIQFVNEIGHMSGDHRIAVQTEDKIRMMASEFVFGECDHVDTYVRDKGLIREPAVAKYTYEIGEFVILSKNVKFGNGNAEGDKLLSKMRIARITNVYPNMGVIGYSAYFGGIDIVITQEDIQSSVENIPFPLLNSDYVTDPEIRKRNDTRYEEFCNKIMWYGPYTLEQIRNLGRDYAIGTWSNVDEYLDYLREKNGTIF